MQYTGRGNRLLWYIAIPLLVVIYFLFRIFVWIDAVNAPDNGRKVILQAHINNLSKSDGLNCLILGGSNAFFSLSAEILSKQISSDCYNLAILNEGFSPGNYWSFLKNHLSEIQRTKITTIIYSSISPFRLGEYERRNSSKKEITGIDFDFELIGEKSMGTVIKANFKKWFKNSSQDVDFIYPLPNSFGDFDFNKFKCEFKEKANFEIEKNHEVIRKSTYKELEYIYKIFPNAQIYFVMPSEYYDDTYDSDEENYVELTIKNSMASFKDKYPNAHIFLINQPPFSSNQILCDAKHHANKDGRQIRTNDLSARIRVVRTHGN